MLCHRVHFKLVDSTNNWVKSHAGEFKRKCVTLVTAEEQTAGRGRFNRQWVSPAGQNVYATFAFFLPDFKDIPNIPQVLAISAAKVIESLGFQPKLKWPNDILLSNKKVSGILCETVSIEDLICVILGIGINVNMPPEMLSSIDRPATSLFAEDGRIREVEEITSAMQQRFSLDLQLFLKERFCIFLAEYRRYLKHQLNDIIHFHDNQKIIQGRFKGINEDGSMNLELPDGTIKACYAGEISF